MRNLAAASALLVFSTPVWAASLTFEWEGQRVDQTRSLIGGAILTETAPFSDSGSLTLFEASYGVVLNCDPAVDDCWEKVIWTPSRAETLAEVMADDYAFTFFDFDTFESLEFSTGGLRYENDGDPYDVQVTTFSSLLVNGEEILAPVPLPPAAALLLTPFAVLAVRRRFGKGA